MLLLPLYIVHSVGFQKKEVIAAGDTRHAYTVDADHPTRTLTRTRTLYGVTCAWMQKGTAGCRYGEVSSITVPCFDLG